jgi:4-phospho-D-threonate 3-dehydrogenase / 4-phospho-D-erythronate 3-dehydrogenase
MKKPVIGITAWDPFGIGPEIALKVAQDGEVRTLCEPVIFGSLKTLDETARRIRLRVREGLIFDSGRFAPRLDFGKISADAGKEALAALNAALLKIREGALPAIVTAPLCKEAVVEAGLKGFTGHTEYIASFAGNPPHCLALYHDNRAIAFTTCHVSLKEAVRLVKKERIVEVGLLLHDFLKSAIRTRRPRIAVSGLNPHAGEGGLFGDEEKKEVAPAVRLLMARGLNVSGPLPPDVIYPALFAGRFDGVVSLVHDHGHVAFKTALFRLGKGDGATAGVNVTLGLPFARTSADHGTAFDIAGKGAADPGSMKDAVLLAAELIRNGYIKTNKG